MKTNSYTVTITYSETDAFTTRVFANNAGTAKMVAFGEAVEQCENLPPYLDCEVEAELMIECPVCSNEAHIGRKEVYCTVCGFGPGEADLDYFTEVTL